jgi:hypothetical protein
LRDGRTTKKKYNKISDAQGGETKPNINYLADGEHVTFLDAEGGRSVCGNVGVTLFEPSELGNEVKVVTANDNGALHSSGEAYTLKDTATDGNLAGEGALLVNVVAL